MLNLIRECARVALDLLSPPKRPLRTTIEPAVRAAIVTFLHAELSPHARSGYREMMRRDPDGWMNDIHFSGGIIVDHYLRGNGVTERLLGVADLAPLWPGLLHEAVMRDEAAVSSEATSAA